MELGIKSGINNKSGKNPVSLVHMFSRFFQEFRGSGISFIVMVNTKFLPKKTVLDKVDTTMRLIVTKDFRSLLGTQ